MYSGFLESSKLMRNWKAMLVITIIFVGCKKPYNPPAIASSGSYLVVEGVINNGSDSTIIKLSKTVKLSNKNTTNPVLGAIVTVESNQNVSYPLTETTNGNYVSAGLNLSNSQTYRLSIKTSNNEQYYSDYVPVLNSPPIDSVYFTIAKNGINIYSNAHDPTNTVKYYRWEYQETWIFHSNLLSGYASNGDTVIARNLSNEVYQCWGNDTSNTVLLGSTTHLSQDVVANNPITSISSTSEKLGTKYSILVKQYGLSADAYTFWKNLKQNTEQLGSIFDAQPSQINGNIHCITNPAEPVIGYISAGTITSKRIFITNQQLPAWLPTPAYTNCPLDSIYLDYDPPGAIIPINQENEYFNYNYLSQYSLLIPVQGLFIISPIFGAKLIGHTGSLPECVDCTLRGTNVQPSFWR
jgi:hypothetical protein